MSFYFSSIPNFEPKNLDPIWVKARELGITSCRIEIDTFLGTVSIVDNQWATRSSSTYIGIEVVVEDLREKWDAMRVSGISDLEFDESLDLQASQLLTRLKQKAHEHLDVRSYRIDHVDV